jgi:trimethylamine:corrinoid methyltransferase-like protein
MEKMIEICGKKVGFKATGGLPYRYKCQFNREILSDLMDYEKCVSDRAKAQMQAKNGKIKITPADFDMSKLNIETLYNILWSMAKTYDNSIPPPLDWLDSFDVFPVFEIWGQVQDIFYANLKIDRKNESAAVNRQQKRASSRQKNSSQTS